MLCKYNLSFVYSGTDRKCPKCNYVNERKEENTHLKCYKCKSIYCYVCGVVEPLELSFETYEQIKQVDKVMVFVELLSPGTYYLFRLRFRTAVGWSPWSSPSSRISTLGIP